MIRLFCTQNEKRGEIMECTKQIVQEHYLRIDGKKIKISRAEKGWTITKLSKESGVTRKTIGEIEKGKKKKIRFSTIYQIAETLGKTVDQLCTEINQTGE